MLRALDFNLSKFGVEGIIPADLPLLPITSGSAPSKEAVVGSVEAAAKACGWSLTLADGARRFGGHTFRVTGCCRLAALDIDILVIMSLARWVSNVVLRYINSAPVKAITDAYRARVAGLSERHAEVTTTPSLSINANAVGSFSTFG